MSELWGLLAVLMKDRWSEQEFREFYDPERPLTYDEWDATTKLWLRNGRPGTEEQIAELARMSTAEVREHIQRIENPNPVLRRSQMAAPGRIQDSMTMMRRSSEIRRVVSRHTRRLLREYADAGRLDARIPQRDVHDIPIDMTPEERLLYDMINEFVRSWYGSQNSLNRQALGFVMTFFKLRMGSSRRSLRRSLERLKEQAPNEQPQWSEVLQDSEEQAEFDPEQELPNLGLTTSSFTLLEDMLSLCGEGSTVDSKFEEFQRQLRRLRREGHKRILVFTQFRDTQVWLREQMANRLTSAVLAGLSGSDDWVRGTASGQYGTTKRQDVIQKVRDASEAILLCTESAAESLNLQFCSAVINYDIPWNPMRLEQRIGRIDRIGQERDIVSVVNLFYAGTAEFDAYRAMSERIESFEYNVGALQPILSANLERIITESEIASAMGDDEGRESITNKVRSLIPVGGFDLDDLASAAHGRGAARTQVAGERSKANPERRRLDAIQPHCRAGWRRALARKQFRYQHQRHT